MNSLLTAAVLAVAASALLLLQFQGGLNVTGHAVLRQSLPPNMFQQLPPIPLDFDRVMAELRSGKRQIQDIAMEYYIQPEFYPTFEQAIAPMQSPRQHWGVMGFGAYPSDVRVSARPGDTATMATIFHTSWLVETYQGMRLEVVTERGQEGYFNISPEPGTLLLEPAYPAFGKGWAQKVAVRLGIKDPPPGTYLIGVTPAAPPAESSSAWSSQYPKYTDAGGFGAGRPLFQISVTVA